MGWRLRFCKPEDSAKTPCSLLRPACHPPERRPALQAQPACGRGPCAVQQREPSDVYKRQVLAASDTRLVNSDLVGPEEMEELAPSRRARGHIVNLAGETPIFQVYQLLSVRQYEERLRRHGHMMMSRRMMHSSSGAARIPNQRLTIFVGYDMTPLLEAESADARRALIHWSVLAFIGAAGLLTLFLVKGYQRSRLDVYKRQPLLHEKG